MRTTTPLAFDLNIAKEMVDSFAIASTIRCRLLDEKGALLYECGAVQDECAFLKGLPGEPPHCLDLHLRGISQASRFGGRYIYSCPAGFTYCSAPIVVGGTVVGALLAGPVLIMEAEDFLDDIIAKRNVPGTGVKPIRQFLSTLPQIEPARLNHVSRQLCANAVYISDSSHALLMMKNESRQQRSIGEYVQELKLSGQAVPYPVEKERELSSAISRGDKATAAALLNELLGNIFFFSPDPNTIQTRITELLVVLSRASVYSGGSAELIFDTNHRYMQELRQMRSQEDIAHWLAKVLNRYTDLVFDPVDSKHKNIIGKAINYMTLNYAKDITLAELADYVGYSHSHFSKVFKEEMGCGFRVYLNELRVEKSKSLLLAGVASLSEICSMCGFEDQSYYCKVFKKVTGVTPDKFRKQGRHIDNQKEYGR